MSVKETILKVWTSVFPVWLHEELLIVKLKQKKNMLENNISHLGRETSQGKLR